MASCKCLRYFSAPIERAGGRPISRQDGCETNLPPLSCAAPFRQTSGRGSSKWGGSSAGRASRSQCEGREFDPPPLHQSCNKINNLKAVWWLPNWLLNNRASETGRSIVTGLFVSALGVQAPCPSPNRAKMGTGSRFFPCLDQRLATPLLASHRAGSRALNLMKAAVRIAAYAAAIFIGSVGTSQMRCTPTYEGDQRLAW